MRAHVNELEDYLALERNTNSEAEAQPPAAHCPVLATQLTGRQAKCFLRGGLAMLLLFGLKAVLEKAAPGLQPTAKSGLESWPSKRKEAAAVPKAAGKEAPEEAKASGQGGAAAAAKEAALSAHPMRWNGIATCAIVQQSCRTGFGDMLLDVIALVAEARVVHSCQGIVTVVLQEGAKTPDNPINSRWYDWPVLVHSAQFQIMHNQSFAQVAWPSGAFGHSYRFCGRYATSVLFPSHRENMPALRLEMQRIARSIFVSFHHQPPVDIHHRVAVHARRGDKIGAYGSTNFLDLVYEHAMAFLVHAGHRKVHLCCDDSSFEPELSRRFRSRGFDVTSNAGAEPEDDAEVMRKSKFIVAATTQSSFSLLSAMLGGRQLYVFYNSSIIQRELSSSARGTKLEMYEAFSKFGLVDMRKYGSGAR
jgi:hypothetical protein